MSLLQDFKFNASMLDHAGWQEITPRLLGLLKWMNDQPKIKAILEDLKTRGPVYEKLNLGRPLARSEAASAAATPRDVATVGLAMMEMCSLGAEPRPLFHQTARSFGIQFPPNHAFPHEYLADAGMKLYIRPLLDYIMRELPEETQLSQAAGITREQLTFEFLKALYDEHELHPLPTEWVKLDDIWKRVVERYGDSLSSELATTAFKHLYTGRLINQVTGPGNIKNIQINERGIAAYQEMNAHRISPTPSHSVDPRTVFVVHGRNEAARRSMFDFLRAIGLKPLEWSQAVKATGEATPYIGRVLDTAFDTAQAVVVLMTPDDEACLRKEFQTEHDAEYEKKPTGQARPNVLFEAGMAMGRDAKRTVLVEIGTLRPFSDVGGRHVLRLDNSSERRHDLADRLQTAGCAVDLSGRDWHTAGTFDLKATLPAEATRVLSNLADQVGESFAGLTKPVEDSAVLEIIDEVNKLPGPPQAVLFEAFIRPRTQTAQLEASDEAVEYLWQDCRFLTMLADRKTFRLKPEIYEALIASRWGEER